MVLLSSLLAVLLLALLVALLVMLLINLHPSKVALLATVTVLDQTVFLLSSARLLCRHNTIELILDQILLCQTTTGSLSGSIVHLTTTSLSKHYACMRENKITKRLLLHKRISNRTPRAGWCPCIASKHIYFLCFHNRFCTTGHIFS